MWPDRAVLFVALGAGVFVGGIYQFFKRRGGNESGNNESGAGAVAAEVPKKDKPEGEKGAAPVGGAAGVESAATGGGSENGGGSLDVVADGAQKNMQADGVEDNGDK